MKDPRTELPPETLARVNGGAGEEKLCPRCGGTGMLTPDIIRWEDPDQPQPLICPDCGGTGRL